MAKRILPGEAVAKCGCRVFSSVVGMNVKDGKARYSGVQTCGSVWHCPTCAGFVAEGRRREIRDLAEKHARSYPAGGIYLAAFTLRHHTFQTARDLRRAVAGCWSKIIGGKAWKLAKAKAHCSGWVRALEVTHGANGWHPHIHAAFFLDDAADAEAFGVWLFERWARAVERAGFGECSPSAFSFERAVHYDAATDYVVKGNFDSELTRGHMKRGKLGGRSPFQLLADAADGDGRAAMLFREFAEAFKGARQVTYSKGLRDDARADEDHAADVPGETVCVMSSATYRAVVFRGLRVPLCEACEDRGIAGVNDILQREGLPHATAGPGDGVVREAA